MPWVGEWVSAELSLARLSLRKGVEEVYNVQRTRNLTLRVKKA